jgi:hypothetical protein
MQIRTKTASGQLCRLNGGNMTIEHNLSESSHWTKNVLVRQAYPTSFGNHAKGHGNRVDSRRLAQF